MAPPAPAAAGRERRRLARRRRLERAALELFAQKGYQQTAVEEVVARAQTSKSAFYEFFSSKEDCLGLLLESQGGALVELVAKAAAQGGDHRDRIRRGIAAFVLACAEHAPLARLLLVESVGVSEGIERTRQELHGRFAKVVEEELQRAPAGPPKDGVDPALFALCVVGAVNEATLRLLGAEDGDPVAWAEQLGLIFAP